jgi:hypothetical protein
MALLTIVAVGVTGCGSDEEESCITGKIQNVKSDEEVVDNYVFIGVLNTSGEGAKYGYIKTVVVPKEDFPLQYYHVNDIISFDIMEVKSTYPVNYLGYEKCTAYICTIKLCK